MSLPRTRKLDPAAIVDERESVTDNNTSQIEQVSHAYDANPQLGGLLNSVKPSFEQAVNSHDIRAPFAAFLDKLGAAERDIVLMYQVEGMSQAEIARTLDVQESVVHEQLERAKKTLSEMMTPLPKVYAVSLQQIRSVDLDADDEPTPEIRALFQCAEPSTEMSARKFQELAVRVARLPPAHAAEEPREKDGKLVRKDIFAKWGLTPRQQEVARMLAETGLSCKEMAFRLNLREGTVRKHIENVYRRLNVQSRSDLVNWWNQNNNTASEEDRISPVRRDITS